MTQTFHKYTAKLSEVRHKGQEADQCAQLRLISTFASLYETVVIISLPYSQREKYGHFGFVPVSGTDTTKFPVFVCMSQSQKSGSGFKLLLKYLWRN